MFLLVLLMTAAQAPGQERREKPNRFYIGGVLSSAATANAFTMEAQVRLGKLFQYPQVPEASKCIRPENKQGSGLWAEKFRKIKIRPKVNLPYETIILLHTKLIFPFFS